MALRDLIGVFLRRRLPEVEHLLSPDPLALEVLDRQDHLEEKLKERVIRRDVVAAQVRAIQGSRA